MDLQLYDRKFGGALIVDSLFRYESIKDFISLLEGNEIEMSYHEFSQISENIKAIKYNNYPKQFFTNERLKHFYSEQAEKIELLTALLSDSKGFKVDELKFKVYEMVDGIKTYVNPIKIICDKNYFLICSLTDVLKEDLKNWKEIDWKLRFENSVFDLSSVQAIYQFLNNSIIKNIDLLSFNEIFNTINFDNKKLKFISGRKVLLCVLIKKISLSIRNNDDLQKRWVDYIIKQFDLENLYSKKSSEKNITDDDDLVLIKSFDKLELKRLHQT